MLVRSLGAVFAGTASLVFLLYFWDALTSVLLAVLGAAVLAAAVIPLVDRSPGPRSLSGSVIGVGWIAAVLGFVSLAGWLVGDAIQRELAHWPEIRDNLAATLEGWLHPLGVDAPIDLDALIASARRWLLVDADLDVWVGISQQIGQLLLTVALLTFGTIYLLVQPRGQFTDNLARLLPHRERPRLYASVAAAEPRLRWWLLGLVLSMVLVGIMAWFGFTVIGLRFSVTLAVAAGLGEIVPVLGPSSVFLAALLVASTQSTEVIVGVLVLWLVIQTLESYIVVPLVMRRVVNLPPLVTLFTLVLWARLLGLPGLLLALPINLVLWSVLEQFVIERHEREPPDHIPPERRQPPERGQPRGAEARGW